MGLAPRIALALLLGGAAGAGTRLAEHASFTREKTVAPAQREPAMGNAAPAVLMPPEEAQRFLQQQSMRDLFFQLKKRDDLLKEVWAEKMRSGSKSEAELAAENQAARDLLKDTDGSLAFEGEFSYGPRTWTFLIELRSKRAPKDPEGLGYGCFVYYQTKVPGLLWPQWELRDSWSRCDLVPGSLSARLDIPLLHYQYQGVTDAPLNGPEGSAPVYVQNFDERRWDQKAPIHWRKLAPEEFQKTLSAWNEEKRREDEADKAHRRKECQELKTRSPDFWKKSNCPGSPFG